MWFMDTDECKLVDVALAIFRTSLLIESFFSKKQKAQTSAENQKKGNMLVREWKYEKSRKLSLVKEDNKEKMFILWMLCLRSCGSFKKTGCAIFLLSQEMRSTNSFGYQWQSYSNLNHDVKDTARENQQSEERRPRS